jgi:hypothetical protein
MLQSRRSGSPAATPSLRSRLVDLESRAGGWPYYRGKAARIEPTCWALLALSAGRPTDVEVAAVERGRAFLKRLIRPDGLLVEPGVPGPNYAWNGLALVALNSRDDVDLVGRLASGLLSVRGIQITDATPGTVQQDGRLQAWSWTEGTFSWVEPTAWCLLALKARHVSAPTLAERVRDAEAVLVDRVCESGGWNYGNSQVLTQDLRPYVPTSALALLALQDQRHLPAVEESLAWLVAHAVSEKAALALALATVCLHVYGLETAEVRRAIADQDRRTGFLGNAHLMAMAAYALDVASHGAEALRIR